MKKKALLLVLAAVVLVLGSVVGTLAYLTAQSDTLVNTFTTGEITSLTIDEALVDANGHKDGDNRWVPTSGDPEQEYPLYPGAVLDKDPTVTVGAGSVPCYVFVRFSSNIPSAAADVALNSVWKAVTDEPGTYVYTDGTNPVIVDTSAGAAKLTPLFTTINVKTTWDGTGATSPEITVQAYAHQAHVNGSAAYSTAEQAAKDLW